jgi:hypothetical protein
MSCTTNKCSFELLSVCVQVELPILFSSYRMYNSHSDSDQYLSATQKLEQYLALPLSRHGQDGGGAAPAEDVAMMSQDDET